MAQKNRGTLVGTWMTDLQISQLEYVQEPGETRSAAIRRLINEKWFDLMQVAHEDYPSISDRENCL